MGSITKNKYETIQIIVAFSLILLITIPMLKLCFYANPVSDDFANAVEYQKKDSGSLINNAINAFEYTWKNASATLFTHIFVVAFPAFAIGGEFAMQFFLFLFMLTFFLAVFVFSRTIVNTLFKVKKLSLTLWFFLLMLVLFTQFTPNLLYQAEMFYWYTGSAAYMLPFSMLLFTIAAFIKLFSSGNKRKWTIILCILVLCLSLSVFLFLFSMLLLLLFISIYVFKNMKEYRKYLIPILIVFLTGMFINLIAPGNYVRFDYTQAYIRDPFIINIYNTFKYSGIYFEEVFSSFPVLFAIFLIAIPVCKYAKNCAISFKLPAIVTLISAILFLAAFFPVFYGYGNNYQPARYIGIMRLVAVLLTVLNAIYWTGWLAKKHNFILDTSFKKFAMVGMALISLTVSLKSYPIQQWISPNIIDAFTTGLVERSRGEYDRVMSDIANSSDADVLVEPPKELYPLLKNTDMSYEPTMYVNKAIAILYNKNSVAYTQP